MNQYYYYFLNKLIVNLNKLFILKNNLFLIPDYTQISFIVVTIFKSHEISLPWKHPFLQQISHSHTLNINLFICKKINKNMYCVRL